MPRLVNRYLKSHPHPPPFLTLNLIALVCSKAKAEAEAAAAAAAAGTPLIPIPLNFYEVHYLCPNIPWMHIVEEAIARGWKTEGFLV
ncbi:hypothetical protein M0804_010123 [Polistes exclamans]|nr:hypothetical protein M0804_010123 [Polistes exclamans]